MTNKEAILTIQNNYPSTSTGEHNDLCEALDMAIKALNTVQEHEETFEWCIDCKEYDKENYCCHRWSKVIRNTVKDIEDEFKIVRCSDCKWHLNGHLCKQLSQHYGSIETPPSFYCGLGERREP